MTDLTDSASSYVASALKFWESHVELALAQSRFVNYHDGFVAFLEESLSKNIDIQCRL